MWGWVAATLAGLLWRGGSWYMGYGFGVDTTTLAQVLLLLANVGYAGIVGGSALVMVGYAVVRRRLPGMPSVVWWLLAPVFLCWLFYLYIVPFKQAYRDLELTRAHLKKDWDKDCDPSSHASLAFHTNCINTERILAQDDVLVASVVAHAAVSDRLLTVGSWGLLLATGVLLVFGVVMHFLMRAEQWAYAARKTAGPGPS